MNWHVLRHPGVLAALGAIVSSWPGEARLGDAWPALAVSIGAKWPSLPDLLWALTVGWLAYGVSLALFVVGLRQLGTARTGAYFSVAPFFGALLALPLLGGPVTSRLMLASGA